MREAIFTVWYGHVAPVEPEGLEYALPECSRYSLSLIHGVFRHGNKTLEGDYPTNPYKDETYYPFGKGQLTNAGKLMGYQTGVYLRRRYIQFLGSYNPEVLEAYASPFWRCKSYLQLMMAGLYPPSENERWHKEFDWQAIPFNDDCKLSYHLFWTYASCPNFAKAYQDHKKSEQYAGVMAPYESTMRYLYEKSGLWPNNTHVFGTAVFLQAALTSQEQWGLKLPAWTESVWPKVIAEVSAMEWMQIFGTETARTGGAGFLMSKIVEDTNLHINRDSSVRGRKIYLYAGHDTNIYGILAWLGVLKPTIINFGAYIIFEIHNIHNDYYVKVLHQNGDVSSTPTPIKIPHCGYCCPFDKFLNLYSARLEPEKLCDD
ncbi:hypothetical protein Trydic_g5956 [Trypoxylus dichotomus]